MNDSAMDMKLFCLFAIFLGFAQANDCKNWRRSLTFEDPHPKGSMLFFVSTSAMYRCSMICSRREECAIFSYNQHSGDCTGFRSFMLSENVLTIPGHVFYKVVQLTVSVRTDDSESYLGTDADVFIELYGSFGATKAIQLEDNTSEKEKFEGGNTDVFNMTSVDVGTLQRITIGHDNTRDGAGWLVDKITVCVNGQSCTIFHVKGWLADNTLNRTIAAP